MNTINIFNKKIWFQKSTNASKLLKKCIKISYDNTLWHIAADNTITVLCTLEFGKLLHNSSELEAILFQTK